MTSFRKTILLLFSFLFCLALVFASVSPTRASAANAEETVALGEQHEQAVDETNDLAETPTIGTAVSFGEAMRILAMPLWLFVKKYRYAFLCVPIGCVAAFLIVVFQTKKKAKR